MHLGPHVTLAFATRVSNAISASRIWGSFLKAKYHSLKARIGGGKAAPAIGCKPLVCA